MKLKLSLPHGKCFIIPEEIQPQLLTLLSQCKIYTENGYSDYTYSPAEDLPEIAYVNEDKINGYKEGMIEAQKKAAKEDSLRNTAVYEKYQTEKKLEALAKEFEEFKKVAIIPAPLPVVDDCF